VRLLQGLNHHYDLNRAQIEQGVKKAEDYVAESLVVDVPKALDYLAEFKAQLALAKFIDI
jgi:hypothetical protein